MRTRAERRELDVRKALRKKAISDRWVTSWNPDWHYYDNLHQYSKNKIHCSCPWCSIKTKNKGPRGNTWFPAHNWKKSDLVQVMKLREELDSWQRSS